MRPSLPILALIATIAASTEATDPAGIISFKSRLGNYALNAAGSALQAKQNLVKSSTAGVINAKTNFLLGKLPHLVHYKTNTINAVLELKKNLLKSKAALIGQLFGGNAIQPTEQVVAYNPPAEQEVVSFSPPGAPFSPPEASFSPPGASYSPPAAPYSPPAAPYSPPEAQYSPQGAQYSPAPFTPAVAPPGPPIEQPSTVYGPPPPQPIISAAAPPVEAPARPCHYPSYVAKRQLTSRQEPPAKNTPAQSIRAQRTPSRETTHNQLQYLDFPTPPPQPPLRTVMYV